MLDKLTRAPLKPENKVYLINTNLIPRIIHQLVLGKVTKGLLMSLDSEIRKRVKLLLRLPHDTPDSFFYTPISNGGMGITNLCDSVALSIINRHNKLITSDDPIIRALSQQPYTIKTVKQAHIIASSSFPSKTLNQVKWSNKLYQTTDGRGLVYCQSHTENNSWITGNCRTIKSYNYIDMVKLRINALPTKSRCNRGTLETKQCRFKCRSINSQISEETLAHILQKCDRSHYARIARHDTIVQFLATSAQKLNWQIIREPTLPSDTNKAKPDLILVRDNQVLIIDVAIPWESRSLAKAYEFKVNKYATDKKMQAYLKTIYPNKEIRTEALIISARGGWCALNNIVTKKVGLSSAWVKLAMIKVMEGSVKIWRSWSKG